MELWVRSQDRLKLAKINYIFMEEIDLYTFRIYGDSSNTRIILGNYREENRARKIIDEIVNILQPKVLYHQPKYDDSWLQQMSEEYVVKMNAQTEIELKNAGQIVYEMPFE